MSTPLRYHQHHHRPGSSSRRKLINNHNNNTNPSTAAARDAADPQQQHRRHQAYCCRSSSSSSSGGPMCNNNKRGREDHNHAGAAAGDSAQRRWSADGSYYGSSSQNKIYCPQGSQQQQQQQMPRHHHRDPQQPYDIAKPSTTLLHNKKARCSSGVPPLNNANAPAEQHYQYPHRRYNSNPPPPQQRAVGNHSTNWKPSPQRTPAVVAGTTTASESIGCTGGKPGGPQPQPPSPRQRRRPSRWGRVNPETQSVPRKVAVASGGNDVKNSSDANGIYRHAAAPTAAPPPPPSFHLCDVKKSNINFYKMTSSEYTVETTDLTASPAVSALDQTTEASVTAGGAQELPVVSGSLQSTVSSITNSLALNNNNNKLSSPAAPHPAFPTNVVVLRHHHLCPQDGGESKSSTSESTQRQPKDQQKERLGLDLQLSLDDRIPRKKNAPARDIEDDEEGLLTSPAVTDAAVELSSSGASPRLAKGVRTESLPDPSPKKEKHLSLPILRKSSPPQKCTLKPKVDRTDVAGASSSEEEFDDVRSSPSKHESYAKRQKKKKISQRRRSLSSRKQSDLFDTDSDDEDCSSSPEDEPFDDPKPSAARARSSRKVFTRKEAPTKRRTNLKEPKPSQGLTDTDDDDDDDDEWGEEAFFDSDDSDDDDSSDSSSSSGEDDVSEEEFTDADVSDYQKEISNKKSNDDNRSNSVTSGNDNNNSGMPDCDDPSLVKVGARVEVYWEDEGEYFPGIVSQYAPSNRNNKPFFVTYSDGDFEWINFEQERFRLLSVPPEVERSIRPSKEIAPKPKSTVADKSGENTAQASLSEKPPKNAKAPLAPDTSRVDVVKEAQKSGEEICPIATTSAEKSIARRNEENAIAGTKKEMEPKSNVPSLHLDQRINTETRKAEPAVPSVSVEPLDWVAAGISKDDDSSDDSETDEEEINQFAAKMFGIPVPPASPRKEAKKLPEKVEPLDSAPKVDLESEWAAVYEAAGEPLPLSISEKVKLAKRKASATAFSSSGVDTVGLAPSPARKARKKSTKKSRITMRANAQAEAKAAETARLVEAKRRKSAKAKVEVAAATTKSTETVAATAMAPMEDEEEFKRRKEEAKPLSAEEIRAIQGEDCLEPCSTSWVRRSVRQPSKSAVNAPLVKSLLEKLRSNDSDMVVLKMKKYCSDSDTPQLVIDAVLDALEENRNCESLYIQNFNEGMRDEQVLRLLRVLQQPSCKIWCLNIGETYKVEMETWEKFANGLKDTKITHLYVSEHTITTELKDQLRSTIRENRTKHNMHCDPNNLDTIIQCTHCWWNPINAKVLRPYVKRRGYEHILHDAEAQGLPGTHSGADLL